MRIWLDIHLSPKIGEWLATRYKVEARMMSDMGLATTEDQDVFEAARAADAVIMTKDSDFEALVERFGPPPRVILVASGNTSNTRLKSILSASMEPALELIASGESLVRIKA
ncbi:MAG: DUF5615 family PIN-like protein [Phycisphaeraceae bacterium]|nr:DUF5615 family PIN-like protein [Phycisphaeraceae bacterium]